MLQIGFSKYQLVDRLDIADAETTIRIVLCEQQKDIAANNMLESKFYLHMVFTSIITMSM